MGYTEAVANQPADQFEIGIYDAATDQFTGPKPEALTNHGWLSSRWRCTFLTWRTSRKP